MAGLQVVRAHSNCAGVTPLHCLLDARTREGTGSGHRMCIAQVLEAYFLHCCIWSTGAALVQTPEVPHRDKLDAFLKQCANMDLASGDTVPIGSLPEQSMYAFFIDEDASAWRVSACIGSHIASDAAHGAALQTQGRLSHPAPYVRSLTGLFGLQAWTTLVQPYTAPPDGRFASILVPTADIVRTSWMLRAAAGSHLLPQ